MGYSLDPGGSRRTGGDSVFRGLLLVSHLGQALGLPVVFVWAAIWRGWVLTPIWVWFYALILSSLLLTLGMLRAQQLASVLRAARGLPEPETPGSAGG